MKKPLKKILIMLNNGKFQEVYINKKITIPFTNQLNSKIYLNSNFFKYFRKKEQKAIIYHELWHLTKFNRFISLSRAFLLLYMLIMFTIKLSLLRLLIPFVLFIIISWYSEISCDINAIKNINKKIFKNALIKAYKLIKKQSILGGIWHNYIAHLPKELRFKIIDDYKF